jgi:hypothetical protein
MTHVVVFAWGGLFPPRQPYLDFTVFFNFSGTDVIEYRKGGYSMNINAMMLVLCRLSAVFQTFHGRLLYKYETLPRSLHYLEYSFSSPLMVMVMAVNVDILELFLVVPVLWHEYTGIVCIGADTLRWIHH